MNEGLGFWKIVLPSPGNQNWSSRWWSHSYKLRNHCLRLRSYRIETSPQAVLCAQGEAYLLLYDILLSLGPSKTLLSDTVVLWWRADISEHSWAVGSASPLVEKTQTNLWLIDRLSQSTMGTKYFLLYTGSIIMHLLYKDPKDTVGSSLGYSASVKGVIGHQQTGTCVFFVHVSRVVIDQFVIG